MSREPVIVDAAIRDEIRDQLDITLFVEAGAGTGKTTALVSRVVSLIATGKATVRDLAAITFTEAAAGELRDRIRYRLEQAADDTSIDGDARERCRAALENLDDAAFSTLHGFAQRILSEHPLEAGLPPRFEIVDDIEALVGFDQRWREFLDALVSDPAIEPVLLTALALGVGFDQLRSVARALHDHYDRLRTVRDAPPAAAPIDLQPVLTPLGEALRLMTQCRDRDDRMFLHLERLASWCEVLLGARDDLDRLDLLSEHGNLSGRLGRKENWRCAINEIRDFLNEAEGARSELLDGQRRAALGMLVDRVRGFVLAYAAERARSGRLEFHDLLVLARQVLQRSPAVRRALVERFHTLLIDEFQDTDPLQIEIAVLLASDDDQAASKPWWDVAITPGRAFFVGDPKQSIYRFRRADLELYHRVESELHGGRRELVQSFRSVPAILDWVNFVFERLFANAEPGTQALHVPLHAARESLGAGAPSVATFGGPSAVERVAELRAVEAEEIATLVRRIVRDGWKIADPTTDERRPARLDDIAVLMPTRTTLPVLEAALERSDVPVRIESQSLVFSTAEVRDLLAILTSIDDLTDEIALVAALRAPAFGCADDELVDYYHHGGRWDYRRSGPGALAPEHPVVAAMTALRQLHDARWWRTVGETVAGIIESRRLLEMAVVHRRPRDNWRRLRFLLDQARAFDESGGRGLRGFVEWVQQLADERARAVEVVVPEPDDDALRILTVHGAKGLEFPIVILAGLNVGPPNRYPPVLWNGDGSFELRVGRTGYQVETAGWNDRKEREAGFDAAERLRLLYVGATRARDHLIVSLHHKERSKCHAASLWEHVDDAPAERLEIGDVSEPPAAAVLSPVDWAEQERPDARDVWIAQRRRMLETASRPANVAATTLAQHAARERDPGLQKDAIDGQPAWRRGRAGTSLGRATHAVLQSVDLDTGAGLDATVRAQAMAEGIPGREAEVRALVRSALGSRAVRAAVMSGRYWREVPVAANIGGLALEGFVDLLFETLEGLVVVDYKTDQLDAGMVDPAMTRYQVQGATYALALERVLGIPVARCVFVFARRGAAIERDVDDLRSVVAEVESQVRVFAG